jgi:hypothetical protein
MLSCCIEPPPQYGQYLASSLVEITDDSQMSKM